VRTLNFTALLVITCAGAFIAPAGSSAAGPCAEPTIQAIAGQTTHGTDGPDVIRGTEFDDIIVGHGGGDVICGGAGDDALIGGPGANRLFGGAAPTDWLAATIHLAMSSPIAATGGRALTSPSLAPAKS
jgi:hypothetical protein